MTQKILIKFNFYFSFGHFLIMSLFFLFRFLLNQIFIYKLSSQMKIVLFFLSRKILRTKKKKNDHFEHTHTQTHACIKLDTLY